MLKQKPPWWFTATIAGALVVAIGIFVMNSGDNDKPEDQGNTQPVAAGTTEAPSETPAAVVTPSSEPSAPTGIALGSSCSYDREGYSIDFPTGWITPTQPAWVCQLFDPEPFVVERHTEPPLVAVSVYVEQYPVQEVVDAISDAGFYSIISSETGTFGDAARPGTILETEQIEESLWPVGTLTFSILVDRVDSTVVIRTNNLAASDYEYNKEVVRAMAMSLRIAG